MIFEGCKHEPTSLPSGHDDELRIARRDGDTFVLGDTNGDGKADFTLRIDGKVHLAADDFIL